MLKAFGRILSKLLANGIILHRLRKSSKLFIEAGFGGLRGGAWGRGGGGEGLRAEVEAVVMVRKGIAWFIKAQRRDIREAKRGKYTLIVHELEEFISWKLNKKKKATHSKLKCTSGKKDLKKK